MAEGGRRPSGTAEAASCNTHRPVNRRACPGPPKRIILQVAQVTGVTAGVGARLSGVACWAGARGRRRLRVAVGLGRSSKVVQEGEHEPEIYLDRNRVFISRAAH